MEKPEKRKLDGEYTCNMCDEHLSDGVGDHTPRNLTCGHHFCTVCLQRLVKKVSSRKWSIECPQTCTTVTVVPQGDVMNLGKCYGVTELMDPSRAVKRGCTPASELAPLAMVPAPTIAPKCDACDPADYEEVHLASHFCRECQQHFCDAAAKSHRRMVSSMAHTVVTMDEIRSNPQLAAKPYMEVCLQHGDPMKLFDLKCCKTLCGHCVMDHKDHVRWVLPMSDAVEACRQSMDTMAQRLYSWSPSITATLVQCDSNSEQVAVACKAQEAAIHTACDQVARGFIFVCVVIAAVIVLEKYMSYF